MKIAVNGTLISDRVPPPTNHSLLHRLLGQQCRVFPTLLWHWKLLFTDRTDQGGILYYIQYSPSHWSL